MADDNKKNSRLKNADTLARRAWIQSAMTSVRLHLNASAFVPPAIDAVGHEGVGDGDPALEQPELEPREERRKHGQLYIAWSEGERRSGT